MINGFSEGVFRQRERNALMPLSQVLLSTGGNFNRNVFLFPRVSLRSCSLQEQPDTALLTRKELYLFAPRESVTMLFVPGLPRGMKHALSSRWGLPGTSLLGEKQHYVQALSVKPFS